MLMFDHFLVCLYNDIRMIPKIELDALKEPKLELDIKN